MRIWRALKALGCVALRDGAYLLPSSAAASRPCAILPKSAPVKGQCLADGGATALGGRSDAYRQLFDRSHDYAQQRKAWKDANRSVASQSASELSRLLRKLQREFRRGAGDRFFPGRGPYRGRCRMVDFSKRVQGALPPDEPTPRRATSADSIRASTRAARGPRRRLWFDRRGQRLADPPFIDRQARFRWLAKPSSAEECARIRFRRCRVHHVGDRVTFEC